MRVQTISETIQKFDGLSYYRCGQYFQRKGRRLHRTVWEYHNGTIPDGYDIHHIDGDRANNDLENLQMLPSSEHGSLHMCTPDRKEKSRQSIKKASEAARAWHGTPAGEAFHSEHAREYWQHAEEKTYTCMMCGKTYQSRSAYGKGMNTFCSNACKAKWRRQQGLDNEVRTCAECGREFMASRYKKQIYCSRECAQKRRWGK